MGGREALGVEGGGWRVGEEGRGLSFRQRKRRENIRHTYTTSGKRGRVGIHHLGLPTGEDDLYVRLIGVSADRRPQKEMQ